MNRSDLLNLFNSALKAANPYNAVKSTMAVDGDKLTVGDYVYTLGSFTRVLVVGAGKGTALMAHAVEEILGKRIDEGTIIVKYGYTWPLEKIRQVEAAHPIPNEAGVEATEEIIRMVEKADAKTLVICLLSGGGSSLLTAPAYGLTLEDKKVTTDILLRHGATINEMNTVRKHLSRVKGGRLAQMASPAAVLTLVLSDVIGNKLDVIASGPTVPDSSTFTDALKIVLKIMENDKKGARFPQRVIDFLWNGVKGKELETPKEGDDIFRNSSNAIIGSLEHSLDAAKNRALEMGFDARVITDKLQGEARDAAGYLAEKAKEVKLEEPGGKPVCLISGGETTVTVKGGGVGGRNQELALAFALEIEGIEGVTMLSAGTDGTDGTDGPTDAAGAVVDGETAISARKSGLDPVEYLDNNDSYNFFKRFDALSGGNAHLLTGPTGTNVMDVQIITVEK